MVFVWPETGGNPHFEGAGEGKVSNKRVACRGGPSWGAVSELGEGAGWGPTARSARPGPSRWRFVGAAGAWAEGAEGGGGDAEPSRSGCF